MEPKRFTVDDLAPYRPLGDHELNAARLLVTRYEQDNFAVLYASKKHADIEARGAWDGILIGVAACYGIERNDVVGLLQELRGRHGDWKTQTMPGVGGWLTGRLPSVAG
jgi:hypothetical protein